MPNGHGGVPRWGSPVLLFVLLTVLGVTEARGQAGWTEWLAYPLAVLFAWRLSWHAVMYPLMEYGGAYASEEALAGARSLHRVLSPVLALLVAAAVYMVWAALGGP